MTKDVIVLGSRGSKLALWQTEHVRSLLMAAAPEYDYEIKIVRTKGDKILDVALSKIGDKGLFTKELERELLEGSVDLCVHSMKDMPTELPEGLIIAGMPRRANYLDAVVSLQPGLSIDQLPAGARVATGSLRRVAQLKRLRPDIETCEIRGNIDSRVKRVLDGEFDAAILACAGLERLGMESYIASVIPASTMIPAVAQGAIAVEALQDDMRARGLCALISDDKTSDEVIAERIVLRELQGGCQVPIGAHAEVNEEQETAAISAFVSSLDGQRFISSQKECNLVDICVAAQEVADDLKRQGALKIMEALR